MHPRLRLPAIFAAFAILAACGDDSSTSPVPSPAIGMHGITITAPNGGETFKAGDSITVNWTADEDSVNDIGIMIFCGAATTETPLYPSSIGPASDKWGSVRAKIPTTQSGSCKIKIRDYQNQSMFDTTDARFTVTAP